MKKIYLLLVSLICLNFGYSQSSPLVSIDVFSPAGSTPTAAQKVSTIPAAEGFTRGAGLIQVAHETSYKSKAWNAVDLASAISSNDYIQWSVTAPTSLALEITEFNLRVKTVNGGPTTVKVQYSYDSFATGGTDLTGNESLSLTQGTNITYSGLSIIPTPGATITFRAYAWGATDTAEGQLNIEGWGSWNIPGLPAPKGAGANLIGEITPLGSFDGLVYTDGSWYPRAPDLHTNETNAKIQSGTYEPTGYIKVKNLTVEPGAKISVKSTGTLQVHGHLITNDNVEIQSNPTRLGGLIVIDYVDKNGINPTVPAQVTGTVKYLRRVNAAGENDLISAPVTGQTFTEFRNTNPNLAHSPDEKQFLFGPFNKATGVYDLYTDQTTATLEPGIGYRAGTKATGTLVFNGTVNIAKVDVPIYESGPHAKEWNLIGNPYPAFIKASEFLTDNGGKLHIEGDGIYGYNPKNPGRKWFAWNQASVDGDSDLAIAPGQGFYVPVSGGATITFWPSMMLHSTKNDFIPGRNVNENRNFGYINLNISNQDKNYNTELYFNDKSSRGLDRGYDARVFGSKAEEFSLYSHLVEDSKGTDMAIQSLAYTDLTDGVIVPLGINVSEGMQVTVSILESDLPEGTEVHLEDNSNNTFTLLTTSDYTFTADSNLTEIGRFFLHISNRALSTPDNDLNGLQIYTTSKSKTLFIKGLLKENSQLNIYDIQGRSISGTQLKANTNSNQVDMSSLSSGIYVIELKNNSLIRTQKVILK